MMNLSEMSVEFRRFLKGWRSEIQLFALALVMMHPLPAHASDFKLGLPVECDIGKNCFFQNLADLDPGPEVRDPLCGEAAYDGHNGTDIRLHALSDIARNIPVVASAEGVVKGTRDGMADRIIETDTERDSVKGKECGNGVLLDHGNGYSTQYCHLKRGSVAVRKGQSIKKGNILGYVGSSGLSQFPHVHLTLRKNGKWLDILSGQEPSEDACSRNSLKNSYLEDAALAQLPNDTRQLIGLGLSGSVPVHDKLVQTGAPESAQTGDAVTVAWGWLINLRKGDVISIAMNGPNGLEATSELEPLDRHKATYSAYSGKRQEPQPGTYQVSITVSNRGNTVLAVTRDVEVR